MKQFFAAALAVFSVHFAHAQTPQRNYLDDPALPPHPHTLNFTHLRLECWPDPKAGILRGKVTETFHPLRPQVDSFFLDGIQMTIGSITVNGQPARYHADSAGITVIPEKPLRWNTDDSVTIDYAAKPAKVSILLAGTTRITSVVNRSGARARRSTTAFGSLCMMNPIIS